MNDEITKFLTSMILGCSFVVVGFIWSDVIPNVNMVFLIGGESLIGLEIVRYSIIRKEKLVNVIDR